MKRVIGMDIHRSFGEIAIWENGCVRHMGRVDMTRDALDRFAGEKLTDNDEVVIEGDAEERGVQWTARPPNATAWRCRACCRLLWHGSWSPIRCR